MTTRCRRARSISITDLPFRCHCAVPAFDRASMRESGHQSAKLAVAPNVARRAERRSVARIGRAEQHDQHGVGDRPARCPSSPSRW